MTWLNIVNLEKAAKIWSKKFSIFDDSGKEATLIAHPPWPKLWAALGYARVAFYCYLLIKLVTGYVPFSSKLVEMLTEGG